MAKTDQRTWIIPAVIAGVVVLGIVGIVGVAGAVYVLGRATKVPGDNWTHADIQQHLKGKGVEFEVKPGGMRDADYVAPSGEVFCEVWDSENDAKMKASSGSQYIQFGRFTMYGTKGKLIDKIRNALK